MEVAEGRLEVEGAEGRLQGGRRLAGCDVEVEGPVVGWLEGGRRLGSGRMAVMAGASGWRDT